MTTPEAVDSGSGESADAGRRARLELLDRVLSAVSHDFNNVLATVSMYAELVLLDGALDPGAEGDVREILEAARRGAALTAFLGVVMDTGSGSDGPERRSLSVDLAHLQKILGRLSPDEVSVTVDPPDESVAVAVDRVRLQQAVFMLAWAASDRLRPDGGEIRIGVEGGADDVRIHVSDTGPTVVGADGGPPDPLVAAVEELVRGGGGRVEVGTGSEGGFRRSLVLPVGSGESDSEIGASRPVVVIGDPTLARLVRSSGAGVTEVDDADEAATHLGDGSAVVVGPARRPVFDLLRSRRTQGGDDAFVFVGTAVDVELPDDVESDPRARLVRAPASRTLVMDAIRGASSAAGP